MDLNGLYDKVKAIETNAQQVEQQLLESVEKARRQLQELTLAKLQVRLGGKFQ